MTDLVWKDPPPPRPRKRDAVKAQLMTKPGEWALIDSGPFQLFVWYRSLAGDPDIETRIVLYNADHPLGARDVYARFKPEVSSGNEEEQQDG